MLTRQFAISPERVMGRAGHRYASIPAIRPECAPGVRSSTPPVETANGTLAVATCEVGRGWTGSGVSRSTDLIGETQEPIRSVVAGRDLQPY